MGADLCITLIPCCKLSKTRLAKLHEMAEDDEGYDKEFVLQSLSDYASGEFNGRRDVGEISVRGVSYYVTGGMTWGDSPTDAFDSVAALSQFFPYLEEWALEDNKKT